MAPSARAIPGTGSTLNAVGSRASSLLLPLRTWLSTAYGNARRCFSTSSLSPSALGTYWLIRVRSRVHLDIFASSERASMTRRLLLFVRNTSDSETIPPLSWCASGAICRTGMPNTEAKCEFHAASAAAKHVMSSTGSSTRRKMVLFQVLNRWRQYRPTLLCLSHSS